MSEPTSAELRAKRRASLARIEKLAFWLDDAFRIPVIGKRVGVDGILGFLPFAGDFAGLALSSLMIGEAMRLGAPRRLWVRMLGNVGIDFAIGLVPLLGDVFDIYFKANRRNQRLMQRWLAEATGASSSAAGRGRSQKGSSAGPGTLTVLLCLVLGLVVTVGLWRAVFG